MVRKKELFSKNFVVNEIFIKEAINQKLDLNEFLVMLSFINNDNKKLDIQNMVNYLNINEEQVMNSINSLMAKKLINIVSSKDENGKICDYIDIDGFSNLIEKNIGMSSSASTKNDIFSKFEKEYGRTLSSMEYELINGWIDSGFSEDMIILALKEAVYNGVTNFRYIDKVLFEWKKRGFKTAKEVEDFLHSKEKKPSKELFDYDWIRNDEKN